MQTRTKQDQCGEDAFDVCLREAMWIAADTAPLSVTSLLEHLVDRQARDTQRRQP